MIDVDNNGNWYNKSGNNYGLYVSESYVASDVWYATWMDNGKQIWNRSLSYDDETIYFAVKVGWDD